MRPHRALRSQNRLLFTAATLVCLAVGPPAEAAPSYTLFESGQVRPLALSPSRNLLFAANTPDGRLEIFYVSSGGLTHISSVSVGLEPVAVAARNDGEVWVVNHLSDSVSVVDVSFPLRPRVVRTLLVGDEPRDIVFAGPGRSRAFITAAHRGQNAPFDPQLTTPGVGRADVWVFNANAVATQPSLGGTPLTILSFFTDTPRALAVSPDGASVYAAGFHTGNRTTAVHRAIVEDEGGMLPPFTNHLGEPQLTTSLIVQHDGAHWVDAGGNPWDDSVMFSLPDKDVFVIDATANPPVQRPGSAGFFTGVGTVLYNMVVNPANGKVYVSNTEAFNLDRFEGPGTFAGTSVRGHLHESRISVLGSGGSVLPRHLNKHIDYSTCCAPVPNAENAKSLATPVDMAVTSDGSKLYVAAFGSSKVGVFQTAQIENDTFTPSLASQIQVTGGGPSGLALDQPRGRLYVLTRFDNSISVVNTSTHAETAHIALHNPEPESVVRGRRFLHDASFSSAHGDSSCASCHVFGDLDSLAWDLGNPDGETVTNPGPFTNINPPFPADTSLKPMKGPMTTQSLRGMANHGPMHWRGDRTGGNDASTAQPDSGAFDERAGFKKFQGGFTNLLGRHAPIPDEDMEAFTDFILQLSYPPNPIRNLDNSLNADQQAGRDHFFREGGAGTFSCNSCHTLDPDGNAGASDFPGFFGTDGASIGQENGQSFKIPHLRNMYQKIGMFGMAPVLSLFHPGDNDFKGDQIRGFGFMHDGVMDTLFRFHQAIGFEQSEFSPNGFPPGAPGELLREQAVEFMLAFDTNLAPIVGQQVTLGSLNATAAWPRIDLLRQRAEAGECDLVAKLPFLLEETGLLYIGGGQFTTARAAAPPLSDLVLRSLAALTGHPVTYTCVPPGSGTRIGIDRDGDGFLDGDECDAGTDPADPTSH